MPSVNSPSGVVGYATLITIALIVVSSLTLIAELFVGSDGDAGKGMVFSHTAKSGRIVFYGLTDLIGRPPIFVNGVPYARIAGGKYFYIDVHSGPVVACIWQPDYDCHTVQASRGTVYYFKATYLHYPSGYNLNPVDAVDGEAERLLEANSPIPQKLVNDKSVGIDLE